MQEDSWTSKNNQKEKDDFPSKNKTRPASCHEFMKRIHEFFCAFLWLEHLAGLKLLDGKFSLSNHHLRVFFVLSQTSSLQISRILDSTVLRSPKLTISSETKQENHL